jgi:hypothetical protein
MLALRAGRLPLVNPAVYHFASGSLWMTTSRYAAKILSARRDPRAAFLVDGGSKALLLRGHLEVYDPLSVSSQVGAMLEGPATRSRTPPTSRVTCSTWRASPANGCLTTVWCCGFGPATQSSLT